MEFLTLPLKPKAPQPLTQTNKKMKDQKVEFEQTIEALREAEKNNSMTWK